MKPIPNVMLLIVALALTALCGCAPQRTPKYGMVKVPKRQADMLRDYQPSESLLTGLTAIVEKDRVVVQVMPLMPGVDAKPAYADFKGSLEKTLQSAFGSRVSVVTE